ncbi:MAG TPA: hypothetical protein DDW52_14485, partial [Planctomycetaceae bacterium]|nr:hypothetical protein [Planctomycetaceae bacterium]
DSLQEAADRFHRHDSDTESQDHANASGPDFNGVEFRKLLGRFIDVCQAIEYAHSRGVLHRDLKPGNIMLGKYGETLVVDWGLAKALGHDGVEHVEGETTLRPASASGSAPTIMGSAIGTPAFMPPEQAAGRLDELSPASDVYSLGATLYYVLTGKSAFAGQDLVAILERGQTGDFPSPRDKNPAVPKPLEAICLRAMATRPASRYASPQELVEDVERFLADEPITAFTEPIAVRARRWVRKHQTLTTATAAVILVSVAGLGVFSSILSRNNATLQQLNTALDSKNRQLIETQRLEVAARQLAESNEESARAQSNLALTTLATVIRDVQTGLEDLPRSGEIRRQLLKTSLTKLNDVATRYVDQARVDHETIVALFDMGNIVLNFGSGEDAVQSDESATEERTPSVELAATFFHRAHAMASQMVADAPQDAVARHDLATSLGFLGKINLRMAELQPALSAYQSSLEIFQELLNDEPDGVQLQDDLATTLHQIGNALAKLGRGEEAKQAYQRSMQIAERLLAEHPTNLEIQRILAISYTYFADALLSYGDTAEALRLYEKSTRTFELLANNSQDRNSSQHDLGVSYTRLSRVHQRLGSLPVALELLKKSVLIEEELIENDPQNVFFRQGLVKTYQQMGDLHLAMRQPKEALKYYTDRLELSRQLAEEDPDDFLGRDAMALALQTYGANQRRLGRPQSAVDAFQESLEIYEVLAQDRPDRVQGQRDLLTAHWELGQTLIDMSRFDEAAVYLERSFQIGKSLAEKRPGDGEMQFDLVQAYSRLGLANLQRQDGKAATEAFRRCISILEKLAEDDPANPFFRRNLFAAQTQLGDALIMTRELDAAQNLFQEAVETAEQFATEQPDDARWQTDLSTIYGKLGDVLREQGDVDAALDYHNKCLTIDRRLAESDTSNAEWQTRWMRSHFVLGDDYSQAYRHEDAVAHFESAADVCRQMIRDNQNVLKMRGALAAMDSLAQNAKQKAAALGDWEEILKSPPRSLPNLLETRSLAFAHRERFTEAVEAAIKLCSLENVTPEQLYNAASVLSMCAASIAAKDGETLAADEAKQRTQYLDDAMSTLQQA